jgi:thioredoxin reductase
LGHRVTVREAGPLMGGMMRFGIPQYRLPRDVLDAEMQRVVDLGVTVELGTKVANIEDDMKSGAFDAAFLAVGAHIAKRTYIPAKDSTHILDAVAVLRSMEGEDKPMLGRRVVVYGGGNTAFDVARTAKRLGATEAIIVYRRNREKMPAHDFECEEALQEGVMVKWLSTIKQADQGALTIEKMALDEKGNPQPTGEFETLEADSLVLALGQDVDLSLLDGVPGLVMKDGVVQVDPQTMMTGHAGIFAGGDMVPADRNVTVAVGHGKKAARNIDAWLRSTQAVVTEKHAAATFENLNPWYYSDAPGTVRPQLEIARRTSSFDEVQGGLTEDNALFEARRTRPTASTTATRMPSPRNISVFAEMSIAWLDCNGSETCTYAPGSNMPSRLGSVISTCIVRVAASIDAAVRATTPRKVCPRSSPCVTVTCCPGLTSCA